MAKLWKVLKVVIFSIGALTLALILWGLIVSFVVPLFKSSHSEQTSKEQTEETMFEKKDGGYKLVVKRKEMENGPDEYFVSVSKDGAPVMKNFRLPTQKYELSYINISDASFVPLRGNGLGVVLYSFYADDEGASDSHIWFLRSGDTTTVREVLSLSEVHRTASGDLTIIGNRRILLPHQGGFDSEQFVVPVSVRIGDTLTISPLLSHEGTDMLQTMFRQEIKAREEKMLKENSENLTAGYRKAGKEMSEALAERSMPY